MSNQAMVQPRRPEPTYRYAYGAAGTLVDVTALAGPEDRSAGPFVCIGCGQRMAAHLRGSRVRHFQHLPDASHCVDRDDYLHRTAQAAIAETLQRCLREQTSFMLRLPVTDHCNHFARELQAHCRLPGYREFNLTKHYSRVAVEETVGPFRADVLLARDTGADPILFEIRVTHACEPEKLASGLRILEILVKNEDDIADLRKPYLTVDGKRVVGYNFRTPEPKTQSLCGGKCDQQVGRFLVHSSGKAHLQIAAMSELARPPRGSPPYVRFVTDLDHDDYFVRAVIPGNVQREGPVPPNEAFYRESVEAFFRKAPIRTCYVCRHHRIDGLDAAIYCRALRRPGSANDAAECTRYAPVTGRGELESLLRSARSDRYENSNLARFLSSRLTWNPFDDDDDED